MIRSFIAHDFILSPNIGPRRDGRAVDMLLLHYTGMASAARAIAWLCNPRAEVSCHYLVDEQGRITQMVGEEMRAWHAGQSQWRGERDTNSRSIGIEIQNTGDQPYPDRQMSAVIALCRDILSRHDIPPHHVLAHSDVAPARKSDPGELFDWERLFRNGIGHWVEPEPLEQRARLGPGDAGEAVMRLQAILAGYGYGIAVTGSYDHDTLLVVKAFQRHFRPARVDGLADRSTLETLARLTAAR
ncbi:MAG: N-acetylmuramoyl-L-alanine amidase [Aestuariivirga sp.]